MTIGGYFKLQIGDMRSMEAGRLIKWNDWPGEMEKVAYFSEFTPHPLLQKKNQQNILRELLEEAFRIANAEDCEDNLFVIMSGKVVSFVEEAGARLVSQEGAGLNWDDVSAREVFETFPKYWQSSPPPGLYKFSMEGYGAYF